MTNIPDSPCALKNHPFAVWLNEGRISIDFHLGDEICDAMDYPVGACAGLFVDPAYARTMAAQLLAGAEAVEANPPAAAEQNAGVVVQHEGDVTTIEGPDGIEITGGPSKERVAHMLHFLAQQIIAEHPEVGTVIEVLEHATERAHKAQQH